MCYNQYFKWDLTAKVHKSLTGKQKSSRLCPFRFGTSLNQLEKYGSCGEVALDDIVLTLVFFGFLSKTTDKYYGKKEETKKKQPNTQFRVKPWRNKWQTDILQKLSFETSLEKLQVIGQHDDQSWWTAMGK